MGVLMVGGGGGLKLGDVRMRKFEFDKNRKFLLC